MLAPSAGINEAFLGYIRGQTKSKSAKLDRALLVCPRQFQRSMLAHQMRQLGVVELRYAGRHAEAKRHLENGHYDLIVFDEDEGAKKHESPQVLLDELRRCGLLEINTIVLITASRATYSQVSEAAESGIDSYLLRPYSLSALQTRLEAALARREAMADIYAALRRKDYDAALEACLFKFAEKAPFWLYAARIAAEIYIAKGRPQQAQHLYEEIVRQEALPWAKLGVGRTLVEQGRHDAAVQHLQEVIEQHPEQTDAYDLMGRAYLESGDREKALEVYRLAVTATPSSVSRLQRLGFAEYYAGNVERALEHLEKSAHIGLKSKSFDLQALWVLAYEAAIHKQEKRLHEVQQKIQVCFENPAHDHDRLQRLKACIDALSYLAIEDYDMAKSAVNDLLQNIEAPLFDFESACNLVTLLSHVANTTKLSGRPPTLEEIDRAIDTIGLRFAHSRLASSWLAQSARSYAPFAAKLERAHENAFRLAQD
ncbi:MAG: tetratricopeptide repeat protein, partial [Rhodocyclaceae bacterium]|nr:tetratricopeptide repeat protein [Rhodocyclaceae bacterium]